MPKSSSTPAARVTLHDVAKAAGVSVTTVSYTLNNRGSIGEEVRHKVLKVAQELGYAQNRAARAMKVGKSEILGLVTPNLENPFFANVAQSVLRSASAHGYQVFLNSTEGVHNSELQAIQGLISLGVDGIVVFPVDESLEQSESQFDIPLVVLDRNFQDQDVIQAEYWRGGALLAEHLLGLGHTHFGLLDGPQDVFSSRERCRGFLDTVSNQGAIEWRIAHPYTMSLNDQAKEVLDRREVTAVVCGNDMIALGTEFYLQAIGARIPEDVSVTGFDDINLAKMMTPPLTTIKMPVDEMASEAIKLLLRRIEEDSRPSSRSRIILDVELVQRNSTGPAPQTLSK